MSNLRKRKPQNVQAIAEQLIKEKADKLYAGSSTTDVAEATTRRTIGLPTSLDAEMVRVCALNKAHGGAETNPSVLIRSLIQQYLATWKDPSSS